MLRRRSPRGNNHANWAQMPPIQAGRNTRKSKYSLTTIRDPHGHCHDLSVEAGKSGNSSNSLWLSGQRLLLTCVWLSTACAAICAKPVSTWTQYLREASIYVKPVSTWSQYLREASIYVKLVYTWSRIYTYMKLASMFPQVSVWTRYLYHVCMYVNRVSMWIWCLCVPISTVCEASICVKLVFSTTIYVKPVSQCLKIIPIWSMYLCEASIGMKPLSCVMLSSMWSKVFGNPHRWYM